MNVVDVPCVICGSGLENSKLVYTEFDLNVVRCLKYGLVYINPRLTEEELDLVYGRNQNLNNGKRVREDKTRDPKIYIK